MPMSRAMASRFLTAMPHFAAARVSPAPTQRPAERPPEESEADKEMREKHGCITVKVAADRAKLSEQAIYNAIRREDVKGMERAGKTYVNLVSLDDWIGPKPISPRMQARKEKRRAARD